MNFLSIDQNNRSLQVIGIGNDNFIKKNFYIATLRLRASDGADMIFKIIILVQIVKNKITNKMSRFRKSDFLYTYVALYLTLNAHYT